MTIVELREGDPPTDVELDSAVGHLLSQADVVSATPSLSPGRWLIAPLGKVGVIRVGDVEIWIQPKIEIRRVIFLLGYALDPRGWRDTDVPLAAAPDLLTAVAYAFARQADLATAQGLLQGYRTVEEALTVVRGRLRESDQMRRRFGLPVPIEVRYDDFTVDIAENQLLRAATERLLRLPRLSVTVRRSLHRLLLMVFPDVSPLRGRSQRPSWQPTRLNARCQTALRLAEIVLAAESFEFHRGSLRVSGFLFDMAKIFEDFVCVAIREVLPSESGRAHLQYRTHLDDEAKVRMRPDLVVTRDLRPVAVLDAKYKAEKPAGFPQADLYQMLAYCTVLGLDTGHLVYARGNEQPATHRVVRSNVTIFCHALDLDQSGAQLLTAVERLVAKIEGVAPWPDAPVVLPEPRRDVLQ